MKRIMSGISGKLLKVKTKANERILSRFPYWKQHNMNMQATQLVNQKVNLITAKLNDLINALDNGIEPLVFSDAIVDVESEMIAVSNAIQSLRTASDQMENDVKAHLAVDEEADTSWPVL